MKGVRASLTLLPHQLLLAAAGLALAVPAAHADPSLTMSVAARGAATGVSGADLAIRFTLTGDATRATAVQVDSQFHGMPDGQGVGYEPIGAADAGPIIETGDGTLRGSSTKRAEAVCAAGDLGASIVLPAPTSDRFELAPGQTITFLRRYRSSPDFHPWPGFKAVLRAAATFREVGKRPRIALSRAWTSTVAPDGLTPSRLLQLTPSWNSSAALHPERRLVWKGRVDPKAPITSVSVNLYRNGKHYETRQVPVHAGRFTVRLTPHRAGAYVVNPSLPAVKGFAPSRICPPVATVTAR